MSNLRPLYKDGYLYSACETVELRMGKIKARPNRFHDRLYGIEPVSCRRVCLLPSRGTESCREYEDQSVANLCDRGWVFSTRLCLLCMPRALCRASSFQKLDYTHDRICVSIYIPWDINYWIIQLSRQKDYLERFNNIQLSAWICKSKV